MSADVASLVASTSGSNIVGDEDSGLLAGATRAVVRSLQVAFKKPVKLFRPSAISTAHLLRAREGVLVSGMESADVGIWQLAKQSVNRKGVKVTFMRYFMPPLALNIGVNAVTFTVYESIEEALEARLDPPSGSQESHTHPELKVLSIFLAGAAAGAVHAVVGCPVDALSPYLHITDSNNNWRLRYCLQVAAKEEGLRGMYRGFGLSLAKDALGFGLFFSVYENTKKLLFATIHNAKENDRSWAATHHRQRALEAVGVSLAGGLAGVSYQLFSYPVHRLKYIMHHSTGSSHTSTTACLKALHRQKGTKLLFQGVSYSVLKAFSPSALAFLVYELATGESHNRYENS
eukprot:comp18705_c1_seq1/m.20435 comp18705_c1_seq1/g.20435  ORF comp18705_c1_seq1/g.20435 comp18705_c1_seq1/m.20435 type:complete len:346 (-) comp18705_c1_seq1:370-1407(-)